MIFLPGMLLISWWITAHCESMVLYNKCAIYLNLPLLSSSVNTIQSIEYIYPSKLSRIVYTHMKTQEGSILIIFRNGISITLTFIFCVFFVFYSFWIHSKYSMTELTMTPPPLGKPAQWLSSHELHIFPRDKGTFIKCKWLERTKKQQDWRTQWEIVHRPNIFNHACASPAHVFLAQAVPAKAAPPILPGTSRRP